MLAGHFTTAILARQRVPSGHIGFYLVASQLPDLLWLAFHYLGLEPTAPDNFMVMTLQTLDANMTYSHDLLPLPVWALVTLLAGRGLFGSWKPGQAGAVLVVVHGLVDFLGGFDHHVFGPDTPSVATALYGTAPYLAITLELVFVVATMAWVVRTDAANGVRRGRRTWGMRVAVFGGGLAFMYLTATQSVAELWGVDPNPNLSGTAMPTLIGTYWGLLLALWWGESQDGTQSSTL
ncbi:MAG: hypothetical protein ACRBN8_38840 [Nannocystales bacterium]